MDMDRIRRILRESRLKRNTSPVCQLTQPVDLTLNLNRRQRIITRSRRSTGLVLPSNDVASSPRAFLDARTGLECLPYGVEPESARSSRDYFTAALVGAFPLASSCHGDARDRLLSGVDAAWSHLPDEERWAYEMAEAKDLRRYRRQAELYATSVKRRAMLKGKRDQRAAEKLLEKTRRTRSGKMISFAGVNGRSAVKRIGQNRTAQLRRCATKRKFASRSNCSPSSRSKGRSNTGRKTAPRSTYLGTRSKSLVRKSRSRKSPAKPNQKTRFRVKRKTKVATTAITTAITTATSTPVDNPPIHFSECKTVLSPACPLVAISSPMTSSIKCLDKQSIPIASTSAPVEQCQEGVTPKVANTCDKVTGVIDCIGRTLNIPATTTDTAYLPTYPYVNAFTNMASTDGVLSTGTPAPPTPLRATLRALRPTLAKAKAKPCTRRTMKVLPRMKNVLRKNRVVARRRRCNLGEARRGRRNGSEKRDSFGTKITIVSRISSKSVSSNISKAVSRNISKVVSRNMNKTFGRNKVASRSRSKSVSSNISKAISRNISKTLNRNICKSVSSNISNALNRNISKALSRNLCKSLSSNISKAVGKNISKAVSISRSNAVSRSRSKALSRSRSKALSRSRSKALSRSRSKALSRSRSRGLSKDLKKTSKRILKQRGNMSISALRERKSNIKSAKTENSSFILESNSSPKTRRQIIITPSTCKDNNKHLKQSVKKSVSKKVTAPKLANRKSFNRFPKRSLHLAMPSRSVKKVAMRKLNKKSKLNLKSSVSATMKRKRNRMLTKVKARISNSVKVPTSNCVKASKANSLKSVQSKSADLSKPMHQFMSDSMKTSKVSKCNSVKVCKSKTTNITSRRNTNRRQIITRSMSAKLIHKPLSRASSSTTKYQKT